MLIPRYVFRLRTIVSKSERYEIDGIRFSRRADGKPLAETTNGQMAAAVTWDEPDPKDYPTIEGVCTDAVEEFPPVTIPADVCAKAEKLCRTAKTQLRLPILSFIVLDETQLPDKVVLVATDLEQKDVINAEPLGGRFPKLHDLYPADGLVVQLNGTLLRQLLALVPVEDGVAECRLTFAAGVDKNGVPLAQTTPVLLTAGRKDGPSGGFGLDNAGGGLTFSAMLMSYGKVEELSKTLKPHPLAHEVEKVVKQGVTTGRMTEWVGVKPNKP